MRFFNRHIQVLCLLMLCFSSCINYRKNLNDEVVLKDQNSVTGTILSTDSANIKLQRIDESVSIIPWANVDTVQGKKLKSFFGGLDVGYMKLPYYSTFLDSPERAEGFGFHYKAGFTMRGNKLYYIALTHCNGKPYEVTKVGLGCQKYFHKTGYQTLNAVYYGGEFGILNAKMNNGAQVTIDPFFGYERKVGEQVRAFWKLALQIGFNNKNKQNGVTLTFGVNFIRKNFKYRYDLLNTRHVVYGKR